VKFLIDNAISPVIASGLRASGYEALHVRDIGMTSATDQVIFDYARNGGYVIVTADTDFGTLLALWLYSQPSAIIFRTSDKRPESQLTLLRGHINEITEALLTGSIVVLEDTRIRIRLLPISAA
jgi:predicted nuclease of predicted toxin-antitoxin system